MKTKCILILSYSLVGIALTPACISNVPQSSYTTDKDSIEILSTSGQRCISGVYPHLTTYAHAV